MIKPQIEKLQHLQNVLDGYGAIPAHWPQDERVLLEFIEEDHQASQIFLEAQALDQLLNLSRAGELLETASSGELHNRIMADFVAHHEDDQGVIVPFALPINASNSVVSGRLDWLAPAALAACFAFGIYLGGIGFGDWTLDPANSLAAWSNNKEQLADMAELVVSSSFEEELL